MFGRSLLITVIIAVALAFTSCDSGKKSFSTEQFKKFVENSKRNGGEMSYEKTKKGYRSIFPKIKMK